jgi:hypothetical protein
MEVHSIRTLTLLASLNIIINNNASDTRREVVAIYSELVNLAGKIQTKISVL